MTSDDRTIIFLHIPRTAGTTLHTIIDRHYKAGEVYSFGPIAQASLEYLHKLPIEERSSFKIIKGHMGYGLAEKLSGRSTYFTLLREPVDRTVSFFYYIRNDVHHFFHTTINETEMSLADFIRTRKPLMFDNAQTRLISGEWLDVPFGRCTAAMLEKAKAHLTERFSVVGLTEHFDATLLLLQRQYGWEHIRYAPKNPARGRPEVKALSPDDLEMIRNFNQHDIALYHHAQKLFQRQLDNQGPDFAKALLAFQSRNKPYPASRELYWKLRSRPLKDIVRAIRKSNPNSNAWKKTSEYFQGLEECGL